MERPQKTEAFQLDFFERCHKRFLTAAARAGEVNHYYRLGGTIVRLCFAGENLVPHLTPALEHLRTPDPGSHDLTLCIWDSESTSTEMLPPPCPAASFTDRGDIWGFNSSRIRTAFHWIEYSVNLMDLASNTGIYWVQTAETLPYWVHASPLRTLFHWWMEKNGCQLLHAAAVGTEQGAVLITGKGGIGKSTTALSCLEAGLYYLADDYAVVRLEPEPSVYSLYSTAKLDADHVHNFPEVSRFVNNHEKLDQEKAVIFLHPHLKNHIISEMPLKAILTPRVVDKNVASLTPAERWSIQRALSFTTMSQLPGVGQQTHDFISRLSTGLPGYMINLGKDLNTIPITISNFLSDMPAHHDFHNTTHPAPDYHGTRPLVSVIIPVFNGEHFIEDAVKNVLSQNYPALEIIIVDDGSIDKTEKIVMQLQADIRYFRQNNTGPASARNRGIRDASGDFILFLDVDDLWPENNICMLVDEIQARPDVEVVRGYAQMMEHNPATGRYDFIGNPRESFRDYIGAALYRKSVFRKVGLFDTTLTFGEDVDWFVRSAQLKVKITRLEETTLYVRRHGRNMTHGKNLLELNTLRVLKKSIDRMRDQARKAKDAQ